MKAPKVEVEASPQKEAKASPQKAELVRAIPDPQIADTVKVPVAEARQAVAAAQATAKEKTAAVETSSKSHDKRAKSKAKPATSAKPVAKAKPAAAKTKATKSKVAKAKSTKSTKSKASGPKISERLAAFEDDPSTVSAAFFRAPEDSFAPVVEEHHDDEHDVHTLSPATLARRNRLRRGVGIAIGALGVIAIAILGRAVLTQETVSQEASETDLAAEAAPVTVTDTPAASNEDAPAPAVEPEAAPAEAADAEDEDAEDAEAEDEDEDADAKDAEDEDADAKDAEADDASELRKEALSLLNRGKRAEAIDVAKAAIAADPSHALPYLYMGSALQDLGQWKNGIEAYSQCVRNATIGPVHECAAMGGRK